MAKTIKTTITPSVDKKTHLGYNEKNPSQPQGAFKADSMETKNTTPLKLTKKAGVKK